MNSKILEHLMATAELCGSLMTEASAKLLLADIEGYPEEQILGALKKCRRELQGRLTLPAILTRIDDGRPGADEAFAMIPKDEADSAVLTQETLTAWGIVSALHDEDRQGARFAFREAYNRLIAESRDQQKPVAWIPSMGSDPAGRIGVLEDAVKAGKIPEHQALAVCPTEYHRNLQIALTVSKLGAIDSRDRSPRVQAIIDDAMKGKKVAKNPQIASGNPP